MDKREAVNILMIEDEPKLSQVVKAYAEAEGYGFEAASSGVQGLRLFKSRAYGLVLLDLMLPGMSGEDVAFEIRRISSVPMIMLTAKSETESKIKGFRLGADDYVTKPFNPRELMERIRAILRRVQPQDQTMKMIIPWAELEIDGENRTVHLSGKEIFLTPKEFDLLFAMAGHPGRIFTREQLVESVFGDDYEGYERTVDVHIKNLRKKMEKNPAKPLIIRTVFGVGYKVAKEAEA